MEGRYIFPSKYPSVQIPEVPLTDFVFSNLEKNSDRIVTVDGPSGRKYTLRQLHDAIKKVAASLHAKGLKQKEVFAIYTPNVPEYPIIFHSVAILGAINTTCNPLYTADELAHQLKDAGAKYIITTSMFLDKVKQAAAALGTIKEIFSFDGGDGATPFDSLLQSDGVVPEVKINPKEDAVVIPYSSGTTGLPKGVVLTHYNLISNILQVKASEVDLTQDDVFIGVLPFFHIYAMLLILNFSIYMGIKTVVIPRFELESFLKIIDEHKITYLHIVPPIILALAKHPLIDKYNLSSIKMIFSGAAPLGAELEKAVVQRFKSKGISLSAKQAYGMSESSPATHINPSSKILSGSIGLLLPNLEAKIVDLVSGESVGVGKEGEICVRGPNVMKEYLNKPDATRNTIDRDGFLHTGDVGYVDENGYYFIVDRVKELIKYKGFQVAPAELEALLLSHTSIADAAVVPVPDEEAGELPKAYVVLKTDHKMTVEEVQKFVAEKTAPHKHLRGGVEFVDQIPKSASGKILRRILVVKERERAEERKQHKTN